MRIYLPLKTKKDPGTRALMQFFADYPFVDLCNVTRVLQVHNKRKPLGPLFPMTWRFLPLLDGLVDHFISRDSDVLITNREVAAVNQWMRDPNATFHLMRDHVHHCAVKILGGTNLLYFCIQISNI